MAFYACIPARGGSKRIPHKNIKDFLGKPLISYPITAALESGVFEDVIVSTDDDEIASVAKNVGASVPFMRSKELADDFTGTFAVTVDAYKQLVNLGKKVDGICCIYATTPLINQLYLKKAFDDFVKSKKDVLCSVCEFPFPIQRAFIINDDGCLEYREPKFAMSRSQDLTKTYQDCGLFYFYSASVLETGKSNGSIPFIMPRHRVIDIDTPEDWDVACAMAKVVKELNLE
jgi:pseudaminic acid cytidylyltransferase